jgi:predicted sulfurtransferase
MSSGRSIRERILVENCKSVAGKQLPPIPPAHTTDGTGSIVLFYQYKEPDWSPSEHKRMLKEVIRLATNYGVNGRGRIAPEGLNCTLSSDSPQNLRSFCLGLRKLDTIFEETDFKLTDGVPENKLFKSLSIRKTEELVAYGLAGEKAPSLKKFAGTHLEAVDYHRAMMQPDTVIIDVRNQYESAIGHFSPPPGGAELIDPAMRNSIEFPKWLADPSTKERLNGKKVLMYCTGGIRCERATALLNQMSAVDPDLQPAGVYHMRGGIERYVKTYQDGGFWVGKNYLFDRRSEQIPGAKDPSLVENEITSRCCLCRQPWTVYRGKFKCSQSLCGVPVIVCTSCRPAATAHPARLTCELCKQGYKAPAQAPDLVELKRKAEAIFRHTEEPMNSANICKPAKRRKEKPQAAREDLLFLGRLPLTVTKTKLEHVLGGKVKIVHWYTDRQTGAFYGSCMAQLESAAVAKMAAAKPKIFVDTKKIRVSFARVEKIDQWPPDNYVGRDYPPIGNF